MTQFAILSGSTTPASSHGMSTVQASELGSPFDEVLARYGMGADAWVPVCDSSGTAAFDTLVSDAQRALAASVFAETALAHFLAQATTLECSICLWYAQDYTEIEWCTAADDFLARVESAIRHGSGEIHVAFRGHISPP